LRRAKREHKLTPYTAGMIAGYVASLLTAIAGALLVLATDSAETLSGVMAMLALTVGSFVAGRAGGALQRRNGLKTGALCGILYLLPLLLLSMIFGVATGALLLVKLLVCVAFGAAGGVFGVNASDT